MHQSKTGSQRESKTSSSGSNSADLGTNSFLVGRRKGKEALLKINRDIEVSARGYSTSGSISTSLSDSLTPLTYGTHFYFPREEGLIHLAMVCVFVCLCVCVFVCLCV